jgi:hypothetical protein
MTHRDGQSMRRRIKSTRITLNSYAPVAVVNILTLIALAPAGPMAGYSASKAAGQTIVFPDDASAGAGSVYLSDPVQLEHLLAG